MYVGGNGIVPCVVGVSLVTMYKLVPTMGVIGLLDPVVASTMSEPTTGAECQHVSPHPPADHR
jgi:hypothetical protein